MDDVSVHYNSDKPVQYGALAYTQGNDVYLGPEQEKHSGHELGHVIQQKQGRVPVTGSVGGVPLNDDPSLEHEADSFFLATPPCSISRPVITQTPVLRSSGFVST